MKRVFQACAIITLLMPLPVFAISQDGPPDPRVKELVSKADNLSRERKYDEAIALLEEAIKIEPRQASLQATLGSIFLSNYRKTRAKEFEDRAIASLKKALEIDPRHAQANYVLGSLYKERKDFELAIRHLEEAARAAPDLVMAFTLKWEILLNGKDFERHVPKIRAEADALLQRVGKRPGERQAFLLAARNGYFMVGDEEASEKVYGMLLAEFPESGTARSILRNRAVDEKDKVRQAALIEEFNARFPDKPDSMLQATLFRFLAGDPNSPGDKLLKVGEAWSNLARNDAYELIETRAKIITALAARRVHLEAAQAMADEIVKIADSLEPGAPLLAKVRPGEQARMISALRARAQTARGFVLLRRGKYDEAAKDLEATLTPVIAHVEKNGFFFWRDTYLTDYGAPSRVLLLAELYEAQAKFDLAAKYLLAAISKDDRSNRFITERLPVVYSRLGRTAAQAQEDLLQSERRYQSMTVSTPAMKEEMKRKLLANRLATPAPGFEAMTLDRKIVRSSDLKGKVVVLNFWATWCGPCVSEMPYFQKVVEKYNRNPEIAFVAISLDQNRAVVRPFIKKMGYKFSVAYDEGAADAYNVRSIPATIIIDRNGTIQFRDEGFGGAGEDYIERLVWRLEYLLKGDSPNSGGELKGEK